MVLASPVVHRSAHLSHHETRRRRSKKERRKGRVCWARPPRSLRRAQRQGFAPRPRVGTSAIRHVFSCGGSGLGAPSVRTCARTVPQGSDRCHGVTSERVLACAPHRMSSGRHLRKRRWAGPTGRVFPEGPDLADVGAIVSLVLARVGVVVLTCGSIALVVVVGSGILLR